MVSDYSLIESDNHAELVEAVADAGKEGWFPQGGICIWYETAHVLRTVLQPPIVHYAQALVKYAQRD